MCGVVRSLLTLARFAVAHSVVQEFNVDPSRALARKQPQQATHTQDGIYVALQDLDSSQRSAYAVVELECR